MARYAQQTTVSSEKSRAEIEATLRRYGADGFAYAWEGYTARIQFKFDNRVIAFELQMPPRSDFEKTETGRARRSAVAVEKAWEQAGRQRWRALALVIKAKLEAVESGISSLEAEFLANTMLPNGRLVLNEISEPLRLSIETGKYRGLLGG